MTDATVKIDTAPPENLHANMIKLTMGLGGVVFLLMMIFGLVMRTAQGGIIDLDPAIFYQLLTAHGLLLNTSETSTLLQTGKFGVGKSCASKLCVGSRRDERADQM